MLLCETGYGNCDDAGETGCEVDLTSTDAHCGGCFKACAATERCVASKCECEPGTTKCGGKCVDVTSDDANCSACGVACPANETCSSSTCQCKPGFTRCGSTCVDLTTSATSCGACGTTCGGGTTCNGGVCCPPGKIGCGGSCVDPALDPSNCGGCGATCSGATPYCWASKCEAACGGGTTVCGGACSDTSSDPKNCGGCGTACEAGEVCLAGACTDAGFPGSGIVTVDQGNKINAWIGTPAQVWTRCFSKLVDGASASTFHSKCDGKGSSVTIAKITYGGVTRIVGGYLVPSWHASSAYIADASKASFLFSITNDHKHPYVNTTVTYAGYGHSSYGPTFGGGHDFTINSTTLADGYCNLAGTYYQCRPGYSGTGCRVDFCGTSSTSSKFTVDDVEVWIQ